MDGWMMYNPIVFSVAIFLLYIIFLFISGFKMKYVLVVKYRNDRISSGYHLVYEEKNSSLWNKHALSKLV